MKKKLFLAILSLLILLTGWYLCDIYSDRSKSITILEKSDLFNDFERFSDEDIIGEVLPSERLKILRIRYGKQFLYVKVKKENGIEGWLIVISKILLNK